MMKKERAMNKQLFHCPLLFASHACVCESACVSVSLCVSAYTVQETYYFFFFRSVFCRYRHRCCC